MPAWRGPPCPLRQAYMKTGTWSKCAGMPCRKCGEQKAGGMVWCVQRECAGVVYATGSTGARACFLIRTR
jgi:hypothetical protein